MSCVAVPEVLRAVGEYSDEEVYIGNGEKPPQGNYQVEVDIYTYRKPKE